MKPELIQLLEIELNIRWIKNNKIGVFFSKSYLYI